MTDPARPPVIVLASTKGGVGKTTVAFCVATELAHRLGAPVACVDADPNRTLSDAVRLSGIPDIRCIEADGEGLLEALRRAAAGAAAVVVDLEGSASQAMLYACGKADLVLVPAQPSRYDVVEAVKTVGVIRQAADLVGRPIAHRVLLTRTPVLPQKVASHSREQFAKAGLPLLEVELINRTAFQRMTYTGEPPRDQAGGEGAAANVAALAREVLALVGLAPARVGNGTGAGRAVR